eukprot:747123-Hanusia_phi.AAC.3
MGGVAVGCLPSRRRHLTSPLRCLSAPSRSGIGMTCGSAAAPTPTAPAAPAAPAPAPVRYACHVIATGSSSSQRLLFGSYGSSSSPMHRFAIPTISSLYPPSFFPSFFPPLPSPPLLVLLGLAPSLCS